ncbi:hypothetical protein [Thermocoleostomius sinensis]|jgi:hypothetical protein|uniref:Uncharacterized protein n=1 Tax=Thermocoleostomius sinensis A174 TaxID=2016057 RepID=A0A9E8ZCN8_9CYAN|nr:hypothetical protein [Thermocoleostomius sinensis]WAL60426.1 hypothetical protein OXH18_00075 [Thermocoleostomius sinensis A174]
MEMSENKDMFTELTADETAALNGGRYCYYYWAYRCYWYYYRYICRYFRYIYCY